ncbi:hypothetical protein ETAA8_06440 [Anatilimnocola aggregata]|uniref:Transmembrane protein n=1 Tax=Anatilimnocola aggregata TaxID=2528021 RepID=A0A517Y5S0_9BACT|nr:hypothetical protein [Anatilimnocola aggregata]QDU25575.1 hypothetical protein ETAA8_06440 [Anatilimnocola aggregata]
MNQSLGPPLAMMMGMACMLAGYLYQSFIPAQAVWTDEQAREYSQNSARLHTATYGKEHDHSKPHSHDAPNLKDEEYVAAKAAFEKSVQARDRALARLEWIKYGLIFTGVIIAGGGVGVVALEKMRSDDAPRPHKKSHKHHEEKKHQHH